jgi:DENN (AEX-3) domain
MVDFSIPKAGSEEEPQSLFGVSLVFQRSSAARYHPRRISQTQLVRVQAGDAGKEDKKADTEQATIDEEGRFSSPLSVNTPSDDHWSTFSRSFDVSEDTPVFNGHLREKAWVDRVLQDEIRDQTLPPTVGVALVSRQNVVIAMRQALWMLLRDFSRLPEDKTSSHDREDIINCGALVDLLGNFAHQDIEGNSLKCILEPYLRAASAPWIERPLSAQKEEFERHAGLQLITSLPPIPLALLFVAALLEQKIILSSSRRSILFSATEALTGMLKPLKWCHLLVPLVPSALAKDLIQYPAPFILGTYLVFATDHVMNIVLLTSSPYPCFRYAFGRARRYWYYERSANGCHASGS